MDRKIPLSPEAIKLLERQKEEFAIRFGREPEPNDPIFFDEDADTPSPMEFTVVPLETLDFTGSPVHLLHMTVGFARMGSPACKPDSKSDD